MEHESPSNAAALSMEEHCSAGDSVEAGVAVVELKRCCNDVSFYYPVAEGYTDEIDSTCSTPYVSAPSSPGRSLGSGCYFFSAPASPMHYILSTPPYSVSSSTVAVPSDASFNGSVVEFEFSAKYASVANTGGSGSMTSADELFLNGKIRPMKLSSHLQRPQVLGPLLDVDEEEEAAKETTDSAEIERDLRVRSRSMHRRTRSMSPSRNARFRWLDDEDGNNDAKECDTYPEKRAEVSMPSVSAPSSLSSSSGRNSKRWVFLKELIYRSKSEGRTNTKEKFWLSISFSPSKDKSKLPPTVPARSSTNPNCETSQKQSRKNGASTASHSPKAANIGNRRVPPPSAHEKLYTENRAQTEEMRKRTYLPYRQGLFGCLGFSSRGYGAMNGLAKTLKTVSSSERGD